MPEDELHKTYLGDGLYASFDGYHIWLRLQTGEAIALDPDAFNALIAYRAHLKAIYVASGHLEPNKPSILG